MYGTQTHSGQCLFLSSTRTKLNTFESIVFDCSYFKNQVESGLVRTIHCLLQEAATEELKAEVETVPSSEQPQEEAKPEVETPAAEPQQLAPAEVPKAEEKTAEPAPDTPKTEEPAPDSQEVASPSQEAVSAGAPADAPAEAAE